MISRLVAQRACLAEAVSLIAATALIPKGWRPRPEMAKIAFYAPLKPPDHPVASGDRAMARALIAALERRGHEVALASRLRSYDSGDPSRQARIRDLAGKLGERLLRRFASVEGPPDLWFTYHLYHKAPDWLGPPVAAGLGIPYVVAEASYAPKQAGGRWDIGHRAAADALRQAQRVFQPNPADAEGILPLLSAPDRLVPLPPFLETEAFRTLDRPVRRADMAEEYRLDRKIPWLLTVAMMRADQKLQSYLTLARALHDLTDLPWHMIIAGAGPAEAEVRAAFAPFAARMRWVGVLDPQTLRSLYAASDIYVWPAVKEAWGMALLEAQAAGLPVIAGRSGGVAAVVADGKTGLLAPEGDAAAFAAALRSLLADPDRCARMGEAAMRRAVREHDISGAAVLLDWHVRSLTGVADG
jgi:glycosyltransferase involved in cell wall biosynthesis